MKTNEKKNPFKIPKGYFDGFGDALKERLSKQESIIPKNDGFQMPEGYLESLQKNVTDRLAGKEAKVIPLKSYYRYYAIAAAIAAMVVAYFGFNWNTEKEIQFTGLASAEITAYLEDTDAGLSSYEIAEVFSLEDLEVSDIIDNKIEEENILEYLNDNIDDLNELNFEENE
ncbi:hypothetical protein [Maribacter sp. 2210JD10-5]|uniref:hypothetical protein n=1 Tax=Maribacter sp. 2210JD10-5 TaxID=3386272 RepID=UPI0039BCC771